MSNELELISEGSGTRYVIIRRHSDYAVWDVAAGAWEGTYAGGSIGDYDVAMTSRAGDLWQADFPDIDAGTRVRIVYYKQIGGSPHDSNDLVLASRDTIWDGGALGAGGAVGLDTYALTTLAKLKRYLHTTSSADDTILTEIINAVSDRIERECGRKFKARDYRERYSGSSDEFIILNNRPLIYTDRAAYGNEQAISVSATGFLRATVQVYESGVRTFTVSTAGAEVSTNSTFASNLTASDMATTINALSGWTASAINNCLSEDLNPITMGCLDQTQHLTWPDQDANVKYINRDLGQIAVVDITEWPTTMSSRYRKGRRSYPIRSGYQNYLIEYNAGYATIPNDLDMLCREISADLYNKGKKDRTLRSETLGDYSYTMANEAQLNDDQLVRLRRWSNIAIGSML